MNKKSKSEFIVENRFKISIILVIVFSLLGILRNYLKEGITILNVINNFWWTIKFFALILITYELLFLLTNKVKKTSLIGALTIAFSSGVLLNFTCIETLIIGEFIVVLLEKLIGNKNTKAKILIAGLIILSMILYSFTSPNFSVAFGYVFLALIIWILFKNKILKDKLSLKILIVITIICAILVTIISINIENDSSKQVEVYKNGIASTFNYLYNILLPFNNLPSKELYGGIISLYPLPMLLALYYLFNKDDNTEFLLPLTIVCVLETVFITSGFPEIIERLTLFSKVDSLACALAINFSNLLILLYFLENIKGKLFKFKNTIRITIVLICMLIFVERPIAFSSLKFLYLIVAELCLLVFLFLNYDDKKYKKVFLFFLLVTTLIGGISILFTI